MVLAAGIMPGIPPRVANETGTLLANQDGVVLLLQPVNARHPSARPHYLHTINIRCMSVRMRQHLKLLQSGPDGRRKRGPS